MVKIKDITEGLEDGDLPSSSGTFWGVAMQGGKRYSQKVVSPFHISMAALEPSTDPEAVNTPVTVWLGTKGYDYLLCTLKHDSLYNMSLDYELDVGEELDLYINGKGTVYLTGYIRLMDDPPPQDWEMDSEDDGGVIEFPESEEEPDDEVVPVKSKSKRKAKKQEDTENPKKKVKKEVKEDLLQGEKQKSSESGSKVEISSNDNEESNSKTKKKRKKKNKNPELIAVEVSASEGKSAQNLNHSIEIAEEAKEDETVTPKQLILSDEGPEVPHMKASVAEPQISEEASEAVSSEAHAIGTATSDAPDTERLVVDVTTDDTATEGLVVDETTGDTATEGLAKDVPIKEATKSLASGQDEPKSFAADADAEEEFKTSEVTSQAIAEAVDGSTLSSTTAMDVDPIDEGLKTIRKEVSENTEESKTEGTAEPVETSSSKVSVNEAGDNVLSKENIKPSSPQKNSTESKEAQVNESNKKKKKKKKKDSQTNGSLNETNVETKLNSSNSSINDDKTPKKSIEKTFTSLPGGTRYLETKEGDGQLAKKGSLCMIKYVGKLKNGKVIDDNTKPGLAPLPVHLGKGEVVEGFEEGIEGMKVGGKRRVEIPPHKGYGKKSPCPKVIPPNSHLTFDIELVKIVNKNKKK